MTWERARTNWNAWKQPRTHVDQLEPVKTNWNLFLSLTTSSLSDEGVLLQERLVPCPTESYKHLAQGSEAEGGDLVRDGASAWATGPGEPTKWGRSSVVSYKQWLLESLHWLMAAASPPPSKSRTHSLWSTITCSCSGKGILRNLELSYVSSSRTTVTVKRVK